jgi:tRNA nucleotidyltransferase (CCA-adding enzyme)
VDPTDPDRNVAAVVSDRNVARFQHYARDLLTAPRTAAFEPPDRDPLSVGDVRDHLDRRGTTPVALRFDRPDVVDDQLYPQLRKSLDGLRSALDRRGFEPLRSATFADGERAVLLIELAVAERPAVERHAGPPVHVRDHADDFHATYADDPSVYGPFVDGDRYVVERRRQFGTAADLLRSDAVFDAALGAAVEPALRDADLLVGEDVSALAERFGSPLRDYFDPRP